MHSPVKVFVGNVPEETSQAELRDLFEAAEPGQVLKVALMKQFAFVHLRDEASAGRAIARLNGQLVHGHRVVVEYSRPRPTHTVKVFVGNVSAACTSGELRALFQEHGPVVECDIVKDYAFVHMEKEEDARIAIEHLNGREVKGKRINVELSTKAYKRGQTGERIPVVNEGLRSASLGFQMAAPATSYSSLEYEYQRLGNTSLSQEAQARQRPSSYFDRDRSPVRRSPPRAGYAVPMTAQQPSYRDQPSASLGMAFRAQAGAAQGSMYSRAQSSSALLSNTYRAPSSAPMGTSGSQAGASALTSYNAQVAAYGAQAAAPQVVSYEAQTSTTNYAVAAAAYGAQAAGSYAASYGAQPTAQLASYGAQPAASQTSLYSSHALSTQAASYGAQSPTGHAASYGAQAAAYGAQSAASLPAAYGAQDVAAASYKTQLSSALPAAYRTPAEMAYSAQQSSASAHLAAGYRAQSAYNGLTQSTQPVAASSAMLQSEAAGLHPPYERARLSPPRGSREDLYRKAAAMNKRYNSDLSEERRLSDLSDYRRLADSPNAYRHSPTKGQLDYRRLPEMQSDYARYAGAYGDYLRSAQLELHANYQRRL